MNKKLAASIAIVAGFVAASLNAQVSYLVTASIVSQNFDTLANTGTGNSWTNNTTLAGWFLFHQPASGPVAITTYDAGTGSSVTGVYYSFGAAASTERALGSVGAGGAYYGSPASGAVAGWSAFSLTNNTGITLNSFTANWNGEQWRNGGNTTAQTMVFEYGFGATFGAVTTWTAPGGTFNFTSPVATATAAAVDGNVAGRVNGLGGTITTPWVNGATLWLRWIEVNDAGNDHGLAIDDFSFSAIPEPGTFVCAILTLCALLFHHRRVARRRAAVEAIKA